MNENLLNIIYLLLGTGKVGEKKLKEFIEEIILNSEYTKEEGERAFLQIKIEFDKIKEHRTSQFYSFVDDVLDTLNLPTRSALQKNSDKIFSDLLKNKDKIESFFKNKNNNLNVVKR